jgi:hypothetical protein
MKNYKERQYATTRKTISLGDNENIKIDEFIAKLNKMKEEGWDSIILEADYNYGIQILLTQERLETDEEYKKRIDALEANEKAAKIKKEKKDKKDLALYEKLKKKFEKRNLKNET